jgi:HEAT repeat protein
VLRASGEPAYQAVAKAFPRLDEGGRRVALDVIDTAPCAISVDVYLHALLGPHPAQRTHAEERLRRCGDTAAERIIALFSRVKLQHVPTFAKQLSLIAPDRAVRVLALRLESPDPELRRELRVALGRAAASGRATAALKELLRDTSLPEAALVDVLRALSPRLQGLLPESAQAFNRIATPRASFRTRFLLLEPAAELDAHDPGARAFLRRSLAVDDSPQVRARAAGAVRRAPEYKAELLRAIDDPELRVREAAIVTLGERAQDFAGASIVNRLKRDEWPLIRAAAAEALSQLAKSAEIDAALGDVIDDPSSQVRGSVIRALGARRAMRLAPEIRERLDDEEEAVIVRASAAAALGLMCDSGAVEVLTRHAVKMKDPMLAADLRSIAPIALASLSRIHPPDLAERLSPLRDKSAPELVRRAAQAAIATPGGCGK